MKLRIVLLLAMMVAGSAVMAQEVQMKKEDMQAALSAETQKQAAMQTEVSSLQKSVDSLKNEGTKLDQETEAMWAEIYAAMGTDKAGIEAFRKQLSETEARINQYASLSDEVLSKKAKELDSLKKNTELLKKDKRAALKETWDKSNDLINRCEQLIQRGKNYTPPKPRHDSYSVLEGDYLWRISNKKEVYADPFQWMKIYSANREQIKNPDMIFPNQTFVIPRSQEANEYWVERGDNLKSISQKVYGSPSDWWKIYNANKSIIGDDSNRIYPNTILIVPKN